jgi:hypothetical protein
MSFEPDVICRFPLHDNGEAAQHCTGDALEVPDLPGIAVIIEKSTVLSQRRNE